MEFVGPGVANLSMDFRIGVDVMTTETTCLSSIWKTDDKTKEFYEIHGRKEEYKELNPGQVAYYDGMIEINLKTEWGTADDGKGIYYHILRIKTGFDDIDAAIAAKAKELDGLINGLDADVDALDVASKN